MGTKAVAVIVVPLGAGVGALFALANRLGAPALSECDDTIVGRVAMCAAPSAATWAVALAAAVGGVIALGLALVPVRLVRRSWHQ